MSQSTRRARDGKRKASCFLPNEDPNADPDETPREPADPALTRRFLLSPRRRSPDVASKDEAQDAERDHADQLDQDPTNHDPTARRRRLVVLERDRRHGAADGLDHDREEIEHAKDDEVQRRSEGRVFGSEGAHEHPEESVATRREETRREDEPLKTKETSMSCDPQTAKTDPELTR